MTWVDENATDRPLEVHVEFEARSSLKYRDARRYVVPSLPRHDITFVGGEACWLLADDGRRYLDFAAGIAVTALGHSHPVAMQAAQSQIERIWHTSNLFWNQPMLDIAHRLSQRLGGAQTFFCNSGSEAIEAAIKYARKSTGKSGVLALETSFHGRTLGALSVTGQPAKREGFNPLLGGIKFARPNNVDSLQAAAGPELGLILLEPVLGEGGVQPLEIEFLQTARTLADEHHALLCFDEIQTGVGRTGTFFAFENADVHPDLVTLAKGLANGVPIGCLLVTDEVAGAFKPGDHASTFGGNPIACAVASVVCDAMTPEFLNKVERSGEELAAGVASLEGVLEVRGAGLLIGAELDRPAGHVVAAALNAGLVLSTAGECVLRLTPPLIVEPEEIKLALEILSKALDETKSLSDVGR